MKQRILVKARVYPSLYMILGLTMGLVTFDGPLGIPATAPAPSSVVVSVLVFSGRPDPSWTLAPELQALLPGFLKGIQPVSAPQWPQFGCRGFHVFAADPNLLFPNLVRVFQGVIRIGNSYFADVNGLEAFLGGTIPAEFDADGNGIADLCEGRRTGFPP